MITSRQRDLVALLNRYAAAYYEQDAPLVSDAEYDALYDEYESEISENYNYYKSFDKDIILSSKEEDALCLFNIEKESEDSITLENATELAIDYLKDDDDGFVLVIEQAHIDKKSHSNDFEGTAKAANSLNDTIESVLEFTKDRNDTAIIVTADHETGGLMTRAPKIYLPLG